MLGWAVQAQTDSVKILVVGDLMHHGSQFRSAYNSETKTYQYENCFANVTPILSLGDLVIGNLETTFAGEPYTGHPNFSAPDEFALAIKNAGINLLMTANDHAADKGETSVIRTISLLDSLRLAHTGTFMNASAKQNASPFIKDVKGIKIAVLNYTDKLLGSSGKAVINRIDKTQIEQDIKTAKEKGAEYIIAYFSWGNEFERNPSSQQMDIANYSIRKGADLVLGTNPHFLQKAEVVSYLSNNVKKKGLVVYSLGNFLSDYDLRYGDGGIIFEINLRKTAGKVEAGQAGFIPTFVIRKDYSGLPIHRIVPISEVELGNISPQTTLGEFEKMRRSRSDTRNLLGNLLFEFEYELNDEIVADATEFVKINQRPINSAADVEKTRLLADINMNSIQITEEEPIAELSIEDKETPPDKVEEPKQKEAAEIMKTEAEPAQVRKEEEVVVQKLKEEPSPKPVATTTDLSEKKVLDESDISSLLSRYGSKVEFRVKFYTVKTRLEINTSYYSYLAGYKTILNNGYLDYYKGNFTDFQEAKDFCTFLREEGFKKSEIVPFYDNKPMAWSINF